MPDEMERVHLDTSSFLPMLWDFDEAQREFASSVIGSLDSKTDKHGLRVFITHLAAGEALMKYINAFQNESIAVHNRPPQGGFIRDFTEVIDRVNAEFIGISDAARKVATKVQGIDRDVEDNDALILGAAMADRNCSKLITTDRDLVDTRAVPRLRDEVRDGEPFTVKETY